MSLFGLRRPAGLAAALAVLVVALAGCGGAGEANPRKIGPRGVDELVVPTPDPDPADFVDGVDNPFLPLAPGTVWTYDASGGVATSLEARVDDEGRTVDGILCVVVSWTTTDRAGKPVERGRRYYAQDRRGNVWLFGEDSSRVQTTGEPDLPFWHAGELGASAGIAMLARPREGDGYFREVAGNAADRATIVSLDEEVTVPAGTFGGVLVTEDASTLRYGENVVRRSYAEGVGLVEETTTSGESRRLVLVDVTPGVT